MDQGMHPSRSRRLSEDTEADYNITSAQNAPAPVSQASSSNITPLGDRRFTRNAAGPPPPCNPAPSLQYDDIWEQPIHSAAMPPPPVSTAPSYNRTMNSPVLSPMSPVGPVIPDGPPRTRQEIYDDFLLERDRIIKEDTERRARNGTVSYEASKEEFEVILARMRFDAGQVAYATREFWSQPGEPFIKNKEDLRFKITTPRLNERGFPLTQYDELQTTWGRLHELWEKTLYLLKKTKPGPYPLVYGWQKEEMAKKAKAKQFADEKAAKLSAEKCVSKENIRQPSPAVASSDEKAETAALASLANSDRCRYLRHGLVIE